MLPHLYHSMCLSFCCTVLCLTSFRMHFTHWARVPIASIACQQFGWFVKTLSLSIKRQKQVDVNFVNLLLLLLRSYQTGYWRADKARMSSVSPEESPVFNCSSLLTTSRDQDSECVRLGPAGWSGLGVRNIVMERQGAVGGCGCALICLNRLQLGGRCSYWQVDLVWTEGTSGFKSEPLPVIDKASYTVQLHVFRTTVLALMIRDCVRHFYCHYLTCSLKWSTLTSNFCCLTVRTTQNFLYLNTRMCMCLMHFMHLFVLKLNITLAIKCDL